MSSYALDEPPLPVNSKHNKVVDVAMVDSGVSFPKWHCFFAGALLAHGMIDVITMVHKNMLFGSTYGKQTSMNK
eukprot:5257241-Karenia_brevis.AAC.1